VDPEGRICLYPIPDEGSQGWEEQLHYVTTVYGDSSANHNVRVFKLVRSLDSSVLKREEQCFSAQSIGLFQSGPHNMMFDSAMLYKLNALKCDSDLSIESFWKRKQLHYERWRLTPFVSLQILTLVYHDFVRRHVRYSPNFGPSVYAVCNAMFSLGESTFLLSSSGNERSFIMSAGDLIHVAPELQELNKNLVMPFCDECPVCGPDPDCLVIDGTNRWFQDRHLPLDFKGCASPVPSIPSSLSLCYVCQGSSALIDSGN
jgi:hypothetical protein